MREIFYGKLGGGLWRQGVCFGHVQQCPGRRSYSCKLDAMELCNFNQLRCPPMHDKLDLASDIRLERHVLQFSTLSHPVDILMQCRVALSPAEIICHHDFALAPYSRQASVRYRSGWSLFPCYHGGLAASWYISPNPAIGKGICTMTNYLLPVAYGKPLTINGGIE